VKTHRFILAALVAAPCFAQDPDSSITLDTLLVTATRSEQSSNRLPAVVTVITRDEIERSGAQHVVEILRTSGVAQVTDFYGDGSRAQVDLRGFGEGAHGATLILVNGRRLNNPDIATPDLSSVSLKDVERIEIIQGSAGALYGDQAVGGVINIVTRPVHDAAAEVALGGGSYGALGGRAQATQPLGDFTFRLSAEDRRTDNYRDHNELEYKNVFAYGEYALGKASRFFVEAGYVDEDLQTPGALFADEVEEDRRQSTSTFQNDFSDTRTTSVRLGTALALSANWQLEAEAAHRKSDGTFRLGFACCGPSTADSRQDREVNAINPRVTGRFPLPAGDALVTTGVDLQKAHYFLSSQIGVQTNEQDLRDAYAQIILPIVGTLEATLGARAARVDNEVFDGFTFVTPTRFHDSEAAAQLGLSLRPLEPLRLFARYDGNFRFAKVDEFTNAGAAPSSNQNPLKTQTGDSYELGGEWRRSAWNVQLSAYRLDLRNEIAFDPTTFTNVNLPPTRRDGQMLRAQWQALAALRLTLGYQHVDAEVRRGSFEGKDIPLVAAHSGVAAMDLALPASLDLHLEWLGTDERAFAGDFDNTLSTLPGHGVLNAALSRTQGNWRWSARVNNMLDREYSEYGAAGLDAGFNEAEAFFPSPGLNGAVQLRYLF
jgi:iron complex outermembrane receptor protein